MISRKRGRQEHDDVEPLKELNLLQRIRNMWEFANLVQWIYTFGRAVKISEDLDIEEIETECLKPKSTVLSALGLALLKYVSSHRGLTPEIFNEYTRRQYIANAPHRNPFGDLEEPANFDDFDVFTKIRVLQQLTQWIMKNPERIREKMDEQKDSEQTIWRIEQFGWDSKDRTYVVLDDNRLYRRTDPQTEQLPAKLKNNSKKAKVARRTSRRSQVTEFIASESKSIESPKIKDDGVLSVDDGLGGMKWECIAVTLEEYNTFLSSLEKSRDPNEQVLRKRIIDDVLPFLKKQEEAKLRKQAQKQRELFNLEKLACAKRSSRIAGKMEQRKLIEEAREAERKKDIELAMANKQQQKWTRSDIESESRIITREQRLKDREARRILYEKESSTLSDSSCKTPNVDHLSESHSRGRNQSKTSCGGNGWIFDCICGAYGQIDDGTHSIACDGCGTWQHSKCVQVSKAEAERDEFSFICKICDRQANYDVANETQVPIKIKLSRSSLVGSLSKKNLSSKNDEYSSTSNSPPPQNPNFTKDSPSNKPDTTSSGTDQPQMADSTKSDYALQPISKQNLSNINSNLTQALNPCPHEIIESEIIPLVSSLPKSNKIYDSERLTSPTTSKLCPVLGDSSNATVPAELNQTPLPQIQTLDSQKIQNSTSIISIKNQSNPEDDPATTSQISSIDRYRRCSINIPSPFTGAPKLTPIQKTYPSSAYLGPTSPIKNSPCPQQKMLNSPSRTSPIICGTQSEFEHALALPPPATGISPTKTSPPRSFSLNGRFGPSTPTMLPPVASLTPSPQTPNLSPPIKPSDPEWSRPAGQIIGQ